MKRLSTSTTTLVAALAAFFAMTAVAHAQKKPKKGDAAKSDAPPADAEPEMTFDEEEAETAPAQPEPELPEDTTSDGTVDLGADATAGIDEKADISLGANRVSWQDIETHVRKPFLKQHRVQVLPTTGLTMNDNIIQHFQFTLGINYFLTDVLAVGLEGQYYVKRLREPYDLVARQARRLPTVNQYNYGAALNFHYVPIYGKFAILDDTILHWETYFTAGIGFTESEVIPRDPALQPFKNFLVTPNIGASMRFFVFKWLTIDFGVRDYIFVDKFEAAGRTEVSGDMAKDDADSSFINNVIFQAGVSFWVPPTFEYTTFR